MTPYKKFKTYKECIPYLFNLERGGIKYNLRNIKLLLKFLGDPQNKFRSIHVAGTNGKGSVSSMINSVLIEGGYRTGLYTSPHISDFRERILVNGKFVSRKFILDITNKLYEEIERIKPSFFEVTTAIAFEYFKYKKVSYAVIETGLGGRLDSTNVLNPILSVITSLSIDHVEFLGNRIEEIAHEKGGIIKKKIPVVTGNISGRPLEVLKRIARKNRSELLQSEKENKIKITGRSEEGIRFDLSGRHKKYFLPLIGDYQINNLKTFFSVIKVTGESEKINFTEAIIKRGLMKVRKNSNLHGRFELISKVPKVIIDVSHNLQAVSNIRSNLAYFNYKKLIIIFAMMQDKNYNDCLSEIGKLKATIILTKPEYKRSADPVELYKAVKRNKDKFLVAEHLNNAVKYSSRIAGKNDLILVTGSFFLAGDYLKIFNKRNKFKGDQ